ncbi:hypothetical protein MP638_005056 [Amoeboaphelidium occidentale]|nr:hypothetical protein MP638_005056 [Amoeboaphelidium occidentale]
MLKLSCSDEFFALKDASKKSFLHLECKETRNAIFDRNPMLELWANLAHFLLMINQPRVRSDKNIVALLIDSDWNIVKFAFKPASGTNESDHAEMLLLSDSYQKPKDSTTHMLITSLYPCLMCSGRINFKEIDICVCIEPDPKFLNICLTEFGDTMPIVGAEDRLWFKVPYLRSEINRDDLPESDIIRSNVRKYLKAHFGEVQKKRVKIIENQFMHIMESEKHSLTHLKVIK